MSLQFSNLQYVNFKIYLLIITLLSFKNLCENIFIGAEISNNFYCPCNILFSKRVTLAGFIQTIV